MIRPEDAERAAAFFRRSYSAADGLWFMMAEGRLGFEAALDLDAQVWEVLPKIQAREMRRLYEAPLGLDGLAQCLGRKLAWEGFVCEVSRPTPDRLEIHLSRCPWQELMRRSGREGLAGRVGERICPVEFAVWAREFSGDAGRIAYRLDALACQGAERCTLTFQRQPPEGTPNA